MRGYLPTLDDIKNACKEIQKKWTEEERYNRWVDLKPMPCVIQSVDDPKLNKILARCGTSEF